ncbi:MAG TPA: XRE family transcriptional regulator [Firmicutes bacterium]|nr:XRE family transcriptional regulator [Bacillota bacterium]
MKTFKEQLYLFGEQVRYYRETRGYTQDELSQISGLHRAYIGQVERGEKNLCLKNVFILSECLNVDPGKLFAPEKTDFEKCYYKAL